MRPTISLFDVALGLAALAILAVTTPLLFLFGRSAISQRGEFVVDPDLLADDPGVDVDGDPE